MWHTQFFFCTSRVSFLATLLVERKGEEQGLTVRHEKWNLSSKTKASINDK